MKVLLVSGCLGLLFWTGSVRTAPAATFPIDFSYAGYREGEQPPFVRAKIAVAPTGGDDTALLQSAVNHVGTLAVNADGFRGAVLLRPGRFRVRGQLKINASGVVLRGSGTGPGGTTILAEGMGRRTLIEVGDPQPPKPGPPQQITSTIVPAGARSFAVADTSGFRVGESVTIVRPSTAEWIRDIVMTGLPGTFASTRLDWVPGSHNLIWDRTITKVDVEAGLVEIDAPITTALEAKYGGGSIACIQGAQAISNVGIENLVLDSAYETNNLKDEEHAWIAIAIHGVRDAWVRSIVARHFVSSAVRVNQRARRVTVEDCQSETPISEPAGYRRQAFAVYGQQVLVQRCHSQAGMNDFASGLLAAGPNVFRDCEATGSLGASGAFEGWSSGVLYERVRVPEASIRLILDQSRAQAAGWTAANSVLWNCTARTVDALGPPGAPNSVVHSDESLYASQRIARGLVAKEISATFRPESDVPGFTGVRTTGQSQPVGRRFQMVNGRIVVDGKAAWGRIQEETWWRGNTSPAVAGQLAGSSVTRFMPGQEGPGLTEDLSELVARLRARGVLVYHTVPGLWYDHRRDAHDINRQTDASVWAPFSEMAWARSGTGVAWDGLSLFDLSHYNPWYFGRLREFTSLAASNGLVVIHNLYNNHNVLEIGPHWIDYPWRPANNINDTGLPEPPPFHPDTRKIDAAARATVDALRLDVANQFYSTSYAPLRKLHHDYIFHVLDELAGTPNVVFTVAYQYAGPLEFQQFFQDTVGEWEKAHRQEVPIALVTSKQITDAILQDPVRSRQIAIVDMRYWQYRPDGKLWAPVAGANLSYRQQAMEEFPGKSLGSPPPTTPEQVYRQIRQYRDRYPKLVLFVPAGGGGPLPLLMGGAAAQMGQGARPVDLAIDEFVRAHLADDLIGMSPRDDLVKDPAGNWVLADQDAKVVLIDSRIGGAVELTGQTAKRRWAGSWFSPETGDTHAFESNQTSPEMRIEKPNEREWLLLLRMEQ